MHPSCGPQRAKVDRQIDWQDLRASLGVAGRDSAELEAGPATMIVCEDRPSDGDPPVTNYGQPPTCCGSRWST